MSGSLSTKVFVELYKATGGENVNAPILDPGTNGTWANLTGGTPGATVDGALEDAGYVKVQLGEDGDKFRIPIFLDS